MEITRKVSMLGHMAMDSPLRRWRKSQNVTQAELARRCGVPESTIAKWEQQFSRPRGARLDKLAEVTGLSFEALLSPERYLAAHPDFLATWGEQPPRRGLYPGQGRRRRPPEEGQP
jgi:transcriptional regulator with XRE-family HTH domain